jgi:hypothetical protein
METGGCDVETGERQRVIHTLGEIGFDFRELRPSAGSMTGDSTNRNKAVVPSGIGSQLKISRTLPVQWLLWGPNGPSAEGGSS